jgi:hypothetical protein
MREEQSRLAGGLVSLSEPLWDLHTIPPIDLTVQKESPCR